MKINEEKELVSIILNGVALIEKKGIKSLYNLNVIVENIRKAIYILDKDLLLIFDKRIGYKTVIEDLTDFAYELENGCEF